MKQSSLIPLAVTSTLLINVYMRRRDARAAIVAAHLAASAVALLYLGIEDYVTTQRMSLSVFVLPGGPFRRINHASWAHVGSVFLTVVKRLSGLIAMIAGCTIGLSVATLGRRLDLLLVIYLLAELTSLAPLCLYNKGSADNYALQAVVFAAVLIGRAGVRVLADTGLSAWRLAVLVIAPLLLLARDVQFVKLAVTGQKEEHAIVAALMMKSELSTASTDQIYFIDRLDLNRLYGNKDLIHDEWLYGAFEQAGFAEPRSRWLRLRLVSGSIRYVVMPDASTKVPGLDEPLPALGFAKAEQPGRYHIWRRRPGGMPTLAVGMSSTGPGAPACPRRAWECHPTGSSVFQRKSGS